MKIKDIVLYTVRPGSDGCRSDEDYCEGGLHARFCVANPMSIYPNYAMRKANWMGPGQDPYVIEILADNGLVGFAANYGGGIFACAIIENHFRRFLVGQDPFNIELIWEQMNRSSLPYGLGGVVGMAMGGVDLALWDLIGKALKEPVYRLIGGQTRSSIPCYVTIHPEMATEWGNRGFVGVKIASPWGVESGREGIERMVEVIGDLRDNVGDESEIMVDCFMSWDFEFCCRLVDRIRPYRVKWIEDPLPNGWATRQNRSLRSRINPIQLATGNLEFSYRAFSDIIQAGATDIIQPEMQWCGGLTAVKRIAAMAKPYDLPVIPHGASVYSYHFVMSNSNAPFAEYQVRGNSNEVNPVFSVLDGEPVPVNGRVKLDSKKPGFGVELNRDRLERYTGA